MSFPDGRSRGRDFDCCKKSPSNFMEGISPGISGAGLAELALLGRGFGGGGYYGGGYYGGGYYGGGYYGGGYYGGRGYYGGALAFAALAGNNGYGPFGNGAANILLTEFAYGGGFR